MFMLQTVDMIENNYVNWKLGCQVSMPSVVIYTDIATDLHDFNFDSNKKLPIH